VCRKFLGLSFFLGDQDPKDLIRNYFTGKYPLEESIIDNINNGYEALRALKEVKRNFMQSKSLESDQFQKFAKGTYFDNQNDNENGDSEWDSEEEAIEDDSQFSEDEDQFRSLIAEKALASLCQEIKIPCLVQTHESAASAQNELRSLFKKFNHEAYCFGQDNKDALVILHCAMQLIHEFDDELGLDYNDYAKLIDIMCREESGDYIIRTLSEALRNHPGEFDERILFPVLQYCMLSYQAELAIEALSFSSWCHKKQVASRKIADSISILSLATHIFCLNYVPHLARDCFLLAKEKANVKLSRSAYSIYAFSIFREHANNEENEFSSTKFPNQAVESVVKFLQENEIEIDMNFCCEVLDFGDPVVLGYVQELVTLFDLSENARYQRHVRKLENRARRAFEQLDQLHENEQVTI
jgi:hypothetical protein